MQATHSGTPLPLISGLSGKTCDLPAALRRKSFDKINLGLKEMYITYCLNLHFINQKKALYRYRAFIG